ncbi:hypothetical protein ACIHDR_46545 [Nocardia sp. NPDC052278]|uniref:hypothetical protein n=1 Tax=unclassified Nocardia TaxID=2637762 RepID=UPI0036C032F6
MTERLRASDDGPQDMPGPSWSPRELHREPIIGLFEGLYQAADGRPAPSKALADFAFPAALDEAPIPTLYCSVTTIDNRGRLAARSAVQVLGWVPGQLLSMDVEHCVVKVRRSRDGQLLHQRGFLILPSDVRNKCRLYAGDRVLIAVSLADEVLVVYPPRMLTAALWAYFPDPWQQGR